MAEPGLPVAAVEHGKKVVVSTNGKQFAVAEHNFTIIPSVTLLCDIPNTIEESGQVLIGVKDAALEPSNPLRHSAITLPVLS